MRLNILSIMFQNKSLSQSGLNLVGGDSHDGVDRVGHQWSLKQELITFTIQKISKARQKLINCLTVGHTISFCMSNSDIR